MALAGCGSKSNGAPSGAGATGGAGGTAAGAGGSDAGGAGAAGADAGKDAPVTPTTTLYLVGDSTVAAFNDPYYYPRYGYGTQIERSTWTASVAVHYLALSGRSSKCFIDPADNANYATFTSSLKAGDYVLIGFGHNDEKADPSLYTNPKTDLTDPTSFQYYLYTYYVKVAQDAGAIPILATPVVRRDSSGAYTGAKIHVTTDVVSGGVTYPGGDYPQAIRDLGAATGVTVIDNTASTLALGKQIFAASGAAGTAQLQAWVSNAVTSVDDTHTNIYGGAYYAYEVATGLLASTSSLKDHVQPRRASSRPTSPSPGPRNPNWTPIVYMPAHEEHQLDHHRSLDGVGLRRRRRNEQDHRRRLRHHRNLPHCAAGRVADLGEPRPSRRERSPRRPTASPSIFNRCRSTRTSSLSATATVTSGHLQQQPGRVPG